MVTSIKICRDCLATISILRYDYCRNMPHLDQTIIKTTTADSKVTRLVIISYGYQYQELMLAETTLMNDLFLALITLTESLREIDIAIR